MKLPSLGLGKMPNPFSVATSSSRGLVVNVAMVEKVVLTPAPHSERICQSYDVAFINPVMVIVVFVVLRFVQVVVPVFL